MWDRYAGNTAVKFAKMCRIFAVKRFVRVEGKKVHMASVSGLLETSHRYPILIIISL